MPDLLCSLSIEVRALQASEDFDSRYKRNLEGLKRNYNYDDENCEAAGDNIYIAEPR